MAQEWLYKKYNTLQEEGYLKDVPQDILSSLKNPLRQYQKYALQRFITYFEKQKGQLSNMHVLFEMATGSGKTLTMAAMILYLYKQGYRNFIFFVNSTTIIDKTKVNFNAPSESKYLFNNSIELNNKRVFINAINSLQDVVDGDINLQFTTIQGLHTTLNNERENSDTFEDFKAVKTVLIGDEAHHLNSSTKSNKQLDIEHVSWEKTIERIQQANVDNILLEFTATAEINNKDIQEKYKDKLLFKYSLKEFSEDKYSKTIAMIINRGGIANRMLLSLIINIFREELLSKRGLSFKPVMLFKSQTIKESKNNEEQLEEIIQNLSPSEVEDALKTAEYNQEDSPLLKMMIEFFKENDITYKMLVNKIKDKIKPEYILNVNDDKDKEKHQLILNSLEDYDNNIRVIFAVDKLNEGWDVLNLFDIIKLYKTKNPKTTTKETQLIGRGARYYPFVVEDSDPDNKYKRKFDNDISNPLRCIEQLHYHTNDEVEFIRNLNRDLAQEGLLVENNLKEVCLNLNQTFLESDTYKHGLIFLNKKLTTLNIKDIENPNYQNLFEGLRTISLPPEQYHISCNINLKIIETEDASKKGIATEYKDSKRIELKEIPFVVFYKAISKNTFFNFDKLTYLGLTSVKDIYEHYEKSSVTFFFDKKQEQHQDIEIISPKDMLEGVSEILQRLEKDLQIKEYQGSEFKIDYAKPIKEVFTSKTILMPKSSNLYEDFEVITSKYLAQEQFQGTNLENKLVAEIAGYLEKRKDNFKEIFLIRNEGHFTIYNFEDGKGFQPDFVLFLQKHNGDILNYQLFVEPKGEHIKYIDKWKEDFLKKINHKYPASIAISGKRKQIIKGLPFYNEGSITYFIDKLKEIIA